MAFFEQFGLKRIVNASGKMTALGGSAVHPKVAEALNRAAMEHVEMNALMKEAGKRIASAMGAEAGCPTASASAGIAISVAATIAGTCLSMIERLPDSQGMKNEIILQKGHAIHFGAAFSQMVRLGGGIVREVGQANKVERAHIVDAVTEKTAALFFVKSHHTVQKGMQSLEEMLAIAKEREVPLIVDAAADEDLRKYIAMGADLVIYSGSKAVGGPTCGFIGGKAPLIEACFAQYCGIGRAMKVGKEAIAGLLTALADYTASDRKANDSVHHDRERMRWLVDELGGIPGISGDVVQDEAGRDIYRARLVIDEKTSKVNAIEIVRRLEEGDPSIHCRNHYTNLGMIHIDPRPLLPEEERLIVERIKEIMSECQRATS